MPTIDKAGGNGMDIDAVLDGFTARRLREADDGGFGGAINGNQRLAPPALERIDA